MKTKTYLHAVFAALALLFIAAPVTTMLRAQDPAIRTRMAQRLSQIDKLKESGALGENNLGFLEVRNNQDNAAALAAAENADRKTVYEAIAVKQKVTAGEVGKARAQQIAQLSRPGVWIQNAQGAWAKK